MSSTLSWEMKCLKRKSKSLWSFIICITLMIVAMLLACLKSFDANDMQSHKLGDATFYEEDLFSPPSFDEEIYFNGTLPPIYDDYCDDTYAIKNKFLQVDHDKNDSYDSYFVEFAPTTIDDFAYVGSNKFS